MEKNKIHPVKLLRTTLKRGFNRVNTKNKSGFSLVELIVVMAIIVIMTGVLLVSQGGNNRNQEDVEAAARKVAAQLRQLQNEALSGKQIGGTSACYFNFVAVGTATYQINYNNCSNVLIAGSSQSFDINTSKNVTAGAITITFLSPRGGSASGKVILTSTKDINVQSSVCVCSSGNILEKKDNSACGC